MMAGCTSGNVAHLPSYISRHLRLGFDSDDVAALISSIDSSQDSGPSPLPHLPAEILFHILEFVPIDHVLTWRLVCRGFRNAIDGPVLYAHLQRAELIGYLGPRHQYPLSQLSGASYEQIRLLRARFDRVNDNDEDEPHTPHNAAIWDHGVAIFTILDEWIDNFSNLKDITTQDGELRPAWQKILDNLELLVEDDSHGTLRWCLMVDKFAMDIDFSLETMRQSISVDLASREIVLHWDPLLFNFIKTETRLRELTEQHCDSSFTYSLEEDCLRAVRRERLRAALDYNKSSHRLLFWEINMLPPLFGRPCYDKVSSEFVGLELSEDEAIETLGLLRKEARMSHAEAVYLKQLFDDRSQMEHELEALNSVFDQWKGKIFGLNTTFAMCNELPRVPRNVIAWNNELREREEDRRRTWHSQHALLNQISLMLNGSIEAMSVPEDAFDDMSAISD